MDSVSNEKRTTLQRSRDELHACLRVRLLGLRTLALPGGVAGADGETVRLTRPDVHEIARGGTVDAFGVGPRPSGALANLDACGFEATHDDLDCTEASGSRE